MYIANTLKSFNKGQHVVKGRFSVGFSLIEVLFAIVVLSGITALAAPITLNYWIQSEASNSVDQLVSYLRKGKQYAQKQYLDSAWGVYILDNTFTLYKGTSFAARDTSYDEVYSTNAQITVTGISEINFAKLSGTPNSTGTITIAQPRGESKQVTINSIGLVSY